MATESAITRASIVNRTLVRCLGQPANFTIDEESELGGIVDQLWQSIVDETFGLHDWTFCRRTFKLNRRADAPVTGFAYAFDLPGHKIGDPLKISTRPDCTAPLRDYTLEAREVHCNEATIYARCRVLVEPEAWDPAFRAAFEVALGSALAIPMLQDGDLSDSLDQRAFGTPSQGRTGGLFGRLIAQNRASEPLGSPFDGHNVLTDARHGGALTDEWWGR